MSCILYAGIKSQTFLLNYEKCVRKSGSSLENIWNVLNHVYNKNENENKQSKSINCLKYKYIVYSEKKKQKD